MHLERNFPFMIMKPVVLLVGHGSRDKAANLSFRKLVSLYRQRHPSWDIKFGFLEFSKPSLTSALERVLKINPKVRILPVFLFAARHWKKDIPALLDRKSVV